jgi:chemotaxis response regulator CheB
MIRVLIVNEVRLLANIIASVLEDEDDIEVVGCSPSFEDALQLIENNHIDVVLLSLKMQKQNALLLTKKLIRHHQMQIWWCMVCLAPKIISCHSLKPAQMGLSKKKKAQKT